MRNIDLPYPSSRRAWFTVFVLMLALVLSFIDRQVISLLVEPIKHDLSINDTQMSLLMGLAFALFYTIGGIPLGRLADVKSRRGVIGIGIFAWSLMTAFCGLAQNFWHLLTARVGVAVGEAALTPAAYSTMADSFAPHRRSTAFAVYQMGVFLGSGLAFLLGGLIIAFVAGHDSISLPVVGEVPPWRFIFIVLGMFGLLFCLLLLALKEPVRRGVQSGVALPLSASIAYYGKIRRAITLHHLGFAVVALGAYGSQAWMPSFLMRSHGLTPAEVGINYGLIVLICGSLGVICGGRLADFLSSRGRQDACLRLAMLAVFLGIPPNILFLVNDIQTVWCLFAVSVFFGAVPFGLAPAALQEIMPNNLRGQAAAVYIFVANIIGLGLGPTAVALVTDYVYADTQALRYSLLWVCSCAAAIGGLLLLFAMKPFRAAKQALHEAAGE